MIIFGVIMLVTAVVFAVVSVQIYQGKTDLIHDYHQTKVTDKAGYGKAFGKAMGVIAVTMALSGTQALLWENAICAVVVLLLGLITGICGIVIVQRKYNGGVF